MHTPLPKRIRTKGKRAGQGGTGNMGFSEMWAGLQKEVELNQRTKSNRRGHKAAGKLNFKTVKGNFV